MIQSRENPVDETTTPSMSRCVLPTNIELNSRDNLNRTQIVVDLPGVIEAVRIYQPTSDEMASLRDIEDRERKNFREFHHRFPAFQPLLNIQRNADAVLAPQDLRALDLMQDIPGCKTRFIHQAMACPSAQQIIDRIERFLKEYPSTENVPLLDMNMAGRNKTTRRDLDLVLKWMVSKGIKRVGFIYRGNAPVVEEWRGYFRAFVRKHFIEVFMLQVPTKSGEFSALIGAFLFGATKVAHRTGKPFGSPEPLFMERSWKLEPLKHASEGIASYNGVTRKQFLHQDKRISYVMPFAKWDRIVQANAICRIDLTIPDLENLPILEKAIRHFS